MRENQRELDSLWLRMLDVDSGMRRTATNWPVKRAKRGRILLDVSMMIKISLFFDVSKPDNLNLIAMPPTAKVQQYIQVDIPGTAVMVD